ncbi:hypothetical protein CYMTET_27249 [Cymbomonas tetramitiformis]|uniref:Uncharacterized protein n=1 Tax=Cymbomonas tetramitiformis TaxID=36881 RepID=A0AAE0FQM6_9CHLO|nr:hypothetical protein CYMTET_27249 [Cymbomonas tetramitiformis]
MSGFGLDADLDDVEEERLPEERRPVPPPSRPQGAGLAPLRQKDGGLAPLKAPSDLAPLPPPKKPPSSFGLGGEIDELPVPAPPPRKQISPPKDEGLRCARPRRQGKTHDDLSSGSQAF